MAPDGKRVAVMINNPSGGSTAWIYDLEGGVRTRLSSANSPYTGVSWSSDGKRLALGGQRDGAYVIHAREIGGSGGEELLFRSDFEFLLWGWLANGRLILTTRNSKTGWDVGYLPPAEKGRDRVPVPVVQGEANETGGYLSRDGRWILYTSDESGGNTEAFVAAFPEGGNRRQVSTTGADVARWGNNDREILFVSHTKLMAAPVRAAGKTLEVGTPRLQFETRLDCSTIEVSCFDATPDGKKFLVIEPTGSAAPVALIQNWTAGLKK
jgi:Tol biopolymer transport system component